MSTLICEKKYKDSSIWLYLSYRFRFSLCGLTLSFNQRCYNMISPLQQVERVFRHVAKESSEGVWTLHPKFKDLIEKSDDTDRFFTHYVDKFMFGLPPPTKKNVLATCPRATYQICKFSSFHWSFELFKINLSCFHEIFLKDRNFSFVSFTGTFNLFCLRLIVRFIFTHQINITKLFKSDFYNIWE